MLVVSDSQIQALRAAEAAVATRFGSHRPARISRIEFLEQRADTEMIGVTVDVVPSNPNYYTFEPEIIVFMVDLGRKMVFEGDKPYWLMEESYYALHVVTASQREPLRVSAEVLSGF